MMIDIEFSSITDGNIDGSGYFDVLMRSVKAHILEEYNNNRVKDSDYASVYLGSIQVAMQQAQEFALRENLIEKDLLIKDTQIANEIANEDMKLQQLKEMIRKYNEDLDKWYINKSILENQKSMSDVDASYKPLTASEDLTTKQTQIDAMFADIEFNRSKKTIMESTRNDNIRMKAAEQFAELLKYISAADVVPAEVDFTNIRGLITAILGGIADPNATATMAEPAVDTKSFQPKT